MNGRGPPKGYPRHGAVRSTGLRTQYQASYGNPVLKESTKKAPEGLLMLDANGENIIGWKNTFASFCEMKYGTIASFVRNGTYPIRATLTTEELETKFPNLKESMQAKMLVESMTTTMRLESKDAESKFEMFAMIESVVTEEGWNRVKSRSGFEAAETAKCPLLLLALVTTEHSLTMNNVSDAEAKYIAEDRYHKVSMGPVKTLAEYSDVFDMCVQNMKTLKCESVPTEERLARHFLMKLDRVR
jgi:hypothetical protein